LLYHCNLT